MIHKIFVCIILMLWQSFNLFQADAETGAYHWNKSRGYTPFKYATSDGIVIENQTDSLIYDYYKFSRPDAEFSLTFRASNINGDGIKNHSYYDAQGKRHSIKNPGWGFFVTFDSDTLVCLLTSKEIETVIESAPVVSYDLRIAKSDAHLSGSIKTGFDLQNGPNIWNITFGNGKCDIAAGNRGLNQLESINIGEKMVTGFGFFCGWGGKLMINDISYISDFSEKPHYELPDFSVPEEFAKVHSDPLEGYYTLFDRELEESLVKMGGNYNLVCFKDNDCYVFLYLDGAVVNHKDWNRGDVKCILFPTPFPGVYDVKWYDSQHQILKHDLKAQKGEGGTLTIQFPYQSSHIRLRKFDFQD